jgi:hypothetical protein
VEQLNQLERDDRVGGRIGDGRILQRPTMDGFDRAGQETLRNENAGVVGAAPDRKVSLNATPTGGKQH